MRRLSLPLVIVGCIALAALLTWIAVSSSFGRRASPAIRAPVATETHQLGPFTKIDVSGSADVSLVQGDAESIALPSGPRDQGIVRAEVRDGTLFVESFNHARWWDTLFGGRESQPTIVIAFKNVDDIAVAGTVKVSAAKLRAESLRIAGAGGTSLRIDDLDARDLKVSGAGALRADLAGRAADAAITISGAGEFRGAKLVTQNASVTVAGAGKVTVNAEKTLKATISGAGSVDYLGDPKVTESVSGAGRVRRREAGTGGTQSVGFSEWARQI
jgi:Putative auto-transporter adhesin, head GIN domain